MFNWHWCNESGLGRELCAGGLDGGCIGGRGVSVKWGVGGILVKLGDMGLELGREIDKSSGRLVLTHPSCLSPPWARIEEKKLEPVKRFKLFFGYQVRSSLYCIWCAKHIYMASIQRLLLVYFWMCSFPWNVKLKSISPFHGHLI